MQCKKYFPSYVCRCFAILEYCDGVYPSAKPIKNCKSLIVD